MAYRRLLDTDDEDFWNNRPNRNDDFHDSVERAANISIGIIIAIVVGIIVFAIVSIIVCIYCVCRRRQASAGTVVQNRGPTAQVTTYSFPATGPQPQPQGYGQPAYHPPPPQQQGYPMGPPPMSGPPMGGPPMQGPPPMGGGGGWTQPPQGIVHPPPPYSQGPPPVGYSEKQKASAPPME